MFVCLCGAVSDTKIRDAIRSGAHTADDVGEACDAGVQCGKCRTMIEAMILRELEQLVGPGGRNTEETPR
ncbi:MAG: (2Fe-2S)-binding protein [Acidimicrobiia bacterium]|jgi:bacterioferritin-associated ferredoxin